MSTVAFTKSTLAFVWNLMAPVLKWTCSVAVPRAWMDGWKLPTLFRPEPDLNER